MKIKPRRDFLKKVALGATIIPTINPGSIFKSLNNEGDELDIHLFSKHLHFLSPAEAAEVAAEIGFKGLDLTVRPKGHVLPENVIQDLPKAVKAINKAGISCNMMTTNVGSASNPLDKNVLETASKNGIKYYRSAWFKFDQGDSLHDSIKYYRKKILELSALNEELGMVGCYQNHAGTSIGSSFWEIDGILQGVDPKYFGVQYDIRHAMVEGANSWENGLKLLQPKIRTIVLKDYKWYKSDGKWKLQNTPMGEGMVDFIKYFKLLKKYKLKPPVSLHLEYPLGGAEHGSREITIDKEQIFNAMKKDLQKAQELWQMA